MSSASNDNRAGGPGGCPICGAPPAKDYAPFCSGRCADVDLHRWLSGGYAIPAEEDDSDGATPPDDRPFEP